MSDPTLETLRELEDSARYVVKRGVPIWVPHVRGDVVVREEDLPAYAEAINRLERERGVLGRITDGHLKSGQPPPKLLGFYRNARVGTFGRQAVPAVLVDCYYRRECLDIVKDRPYRSPEVYPKRREIRGLALLLNDPYLDMGTITYENNLVARPICYGGEPMPEAMGAENAGVAQEVKPKKQPEEFKPEETELFERMCRYLRSRYGLSENWPSPDPDNDKAEGAGDKSDSDAVNEADSVVQMERGALPVEYARQVNELKARLSGLELERDQERCQMLLYGLEVEGFQLSEVEKKKELARLVQLPASERRERISEMRLIYANRKVPGGKLQLYAGPVEGGSDHDPHKAPWYHEPAMAYMRANPGTQYDVACRLVQTQASQQK